MPGWATGKLPPAGTFHNRDVLSQLLLRAIRLLAEKHTLEITPDLGCQSRKALGAVVVPRLAGWGSHRAGRPSA